MLYQKDDVPASVLIMQWRITDHAAALANGTVAAALHAACFICDRAVERGFLPPKDVLGDDGLLHSLIHAAAGDVSISLLGLERRARALEVAMSG